MSPRRGLGVLLGLGVLATGATVPSGATYTATSANRMQVVAAAADWVAPTVAVDAPAVVLRATVTLTAVAADGGAGVATVRIQRSPAGQSTWTDVCGDGTAPYGCVLDTTTLADGLYDLRAIAVDRADNAATSATVAAVMVDNDAPAVALENPGSYVRAVFALVATAGDGAGSGVGTVRLQRSLADAAVWTDICTDASAPFGCSLDTTTLANDVFDLRAIATDGAGNTATSQIVTVQVDNVLPTITMTDPGATISGTITLATTPADADSGVARVTIQRSPAGLGSWTDACVIVAAPWSCRFDTLSVADGLYDLRAITLDLAGNSRTSATVTGRRVDNTTVNTVSLEDPGAFMRGTVALLANANAVGGVASVRIQRSIAGAGTWTDVCADTTAPYGCSLDTTTAATPDGSYDLRAIMTTNLAATLTSATVAGRWIDNTLVRGVDVQAANKIAGKLGRLEPGD